MGLLRGLRWSREEWRRGGCGTWQPPAHRPGHVTPGAARAGSGVARGGVGGVKDLPERECPVRPRRGSRTPTPRLVSPTDSQDGGASDQRRAGLLTSEGNALPAASPGLRGRAGGPWSQMRVKGSRPVRDPDLGLSVEDPMVRLAPSHGPNAGRTEALVPQGNDQGGKEPEGWAGGAEAAGPTGAPGTGASQGPALLWGREALLSGPAGQAEQQAHRSSVSRNIVLASSRAARGWGGTTARLPGDPQRSPEHPGARLLPSLSRCVDTS